MNCTLLNEEPNEAHVSEVLRDAFAGLRANNAERRAAVEIAIPALHRLCDVMAAMTGQSYKVRALLYSLWNGAPRSLLDVVDLDWSLRKDLGAVVLAFGFEQGSTAFYYDALKEAVSDRGIWKWFIKEGEVQP